MEHSYLGEKLNLCENDEKLINNENNDDSTTKQTTTDGVGGGGGVIVSDTVTAELSDHVQFLITEVSGPKTPKIEENEPPDDFNILAEGKYILLT